MPASFAFVAWSAVIVALCVPADIVSAQPRRITPDALARTVDSIAARAIADGLTPALGVAVVMDGRTVLARSYGLVDTDAKRRANDQTLWYLASTSKSLTGFGVALLAHDGALQLSDPITALLPRAPWHPTVRADSLTLAHFLSHTHRVDDRAIVMSAAFTGAITETRWPQLLALASQANSTDLVYSNLGYNVAAMVIDAKRPEGWKRYLHDAVYRPAGMRVTYARVSGIDATRIARPHRTRHDGTFATTPFFKTDATMNAAGGHLATLSDLARWTIVQMDSGMLDGRRVFPAAAVALGHRLLARHTLDAAKRFAFFDRDGWASGWDIGTYDGVRMVSRFGSYDATRSHLSFLPSRRIGVVAMSNGGISAVTDVVAALAYDLEAGRSDAIDRARTRLDEIRSRQQASVRAVSTQDSIRAQRQQHPARRPLRDFVGVYADPAFGTIEFSINDGTLQFRWGALYGPVEYFAAEKHQMRLEIAGSGAVATFTFSGDAAATGVATSVALQGATLRRMTP